MATRIGVDIGGTFTDLIYYDETTGETVEGKVPTVPHAPEEGVIHAVEAHVPPGVIVDAAYFLHGTTVGLNALLERRGAEVGLLATQGFRDVLEIRRGDRAEMYNLFWRQPPALVPRRRRLEVPGRIMADGSVYVAVDEDAARTAIRALMRFGVDAIAVALINAWANPEHELLVERLIRDEGFAGGISLSHRISGEYREYERTSTTVIDAFVRGRMSNYLRRLERRLRDLGFTGTALITRSGSGSMSFAEAEDRPFETIMSGPVGGAHGASEFARSLGIDALITADVGGTSFDTALILGGEPQVLYEGMIDGMPVQTAWVDVRSIGAGGGSLAQVDRGGLMRVGPQSAGAVPGPACYGKGGTQPALTDAAAYLGMLGPGELASGITLDIGASEAALARVAETLGQEVETVATGVLRIAAAAMGGAMRELTVEQGLDPRGMTLLPFGGAGPLMACLLAEDLGMSRIVLPPFAGNFSAWGLLGADRVQSASRTMVADLDTAGLSRAQALLDALLAELEARGARPGKATAAARLDLRYKGQEHSLSVDLPLDGATIADDTDDIRAAFAAEYQKTFGGTLDEQIETVAVRATYTEALAPREIRVPAPQPAPAETTTIETHSFALNRRTAFAILPRGSIAGATTGPCIVTETTSTLYVDAGWTIRPGGQGELILERKEI
ncbi:hydantoinase/oxoprolinase family protein [Salipiger abyssi]|uniref:hydantoinase/oxoprolinase family protein n=1 Tax=Salipiger abyssi TaxID=1250539 RepID=UPI001A90B578|nr:hydantoinase/oxoprolinase family protein [Salipiger abyssi]MBN9887231.1 hydantoinase/oxoprolinase family protein [Salipiger abyssi]